MLYLLKFGRLTLFYSIYLHNSGKKYLCTAKTVEHSTVFAVELFEIMIIKKRIEALALKQQGTRGGQSGFIVLSHQRNRLCPLPLLA